MIERRHYTKMVVITEDLWKSVTEALGRFRPKESGSGLGDG